MGPSTQKIACVTVYAYSALCFAVSHCAVWVMWLSKNTLVLCSSLRDVYVFELTSLTCIVSEVLTRVEIALQQDAILIYITQGISFRNLLHKSVCERWTCEIWPLISTHWITPQSTNRKTVHTDTPKSPWCLSNNHIGDGLSEKGRFPVGYHYGISY